MPSAKTALHYQKDCIGPEQPESEQQQAVGEAKEDPEPEDEVYI